MTRWSNVYVSKDPNFFDFEKLIYFDFYFLISRPASAVDVSKSISVATQSALVLRLENELEAQRIE